MSRVNWKPYVAVGVAILLTALVGFAIYRSASNPGAAVAATEIKAIAVLPFMSVEPGDDNKLIGIGMADAVIAKLSHVKSVAVRQTSSVIRYADSTPEAVRIGRDINVDAVLEGTIQKADFRIRVSVRLFRVSDGSLIWAETFDERETDIFSVQDAISERVANSLSLQLTGDERVRFNRRSTGNLEAYLLYNKGRFFWNRRNSEDLRKSIDLYEQAIAKDPNYALAYAGIAESYVLLHTYSRHHESDLFPRARAAAEKALSLDENLAEAHAALALYREQYEWNWAEAEQGFKRAIAANPSYATAHQWYGEFLAFRGRTDESIVEVRKALDLDPLSLSTNAAQAFPLIAGRRWAEAIEKVQPALELDKNFPFALYYLARSYEGLGEYDRAIENYQKAIEVSGASAFFSSAMIHSLVKAGKRAEAERHLSLILENDRNEPVSRYVLARGLAALGERARALDALEQAHENRDGLLTVIQIDPNFDEIRDDPRFKNIVKKIGF